jgi:hypothetical protein
MSDLLTAARQALEALEWNHNTDLDDIPACEQWAKMLKENITALRQAIEQAEQQEPVAWRYNGNLHEFDPSDWATGPVTPLYTTPPQRKPLTDEEVVALFNRLCQERSAWPERRYRDFARWVERAHGIGGGE